MGRLTTIEIRCVKCGLTKEIEAEFGMYDHIIFASNEGRRWANEAGWKRVHIKEIYNPQRRIPTLSKELCPACYNNIGEWAERGKGD